MKFDIVGEIEQIETIAMGNSIRELPRLIKYYGDGRWRKMKGIARVQLSDKTFIRAEIHWYEADGIGRKEFKIKRFLG